MDKEFKEWWERNKRIYPTKLQDNPHWAEDAFLAGRESSLDEAVEKAYDKGFDEGAAKQAILELQGRDKFIESLKDNQSLDQAVRELGEIEICGWCENRRIGKPQVSGYDLPMVCEHCGSNMNTRLSYKNIHKWVKDWITLYHRPRPRPRKGD